MKINRTYKYRLYPTVKQQKTIDYQLGLLRKIYNKFLKQRIDLYEKKGVRLNYYHQQNQLPLIKDNKPEYADMYAQSLRYQVKILDTAFKNFLEGLKKVKSQDSHVLKVKVELIQFITRNMDLKLLMEN